MVNYVVFRSMMVSHHAQYGAIQKLRGQDFDHF